MLWQALRLRCPKCGTRWGFAHWLRPSPACANCSQPLERAEDGHYLGALVLNFAITESLLAIIVVATIIVTQPSPPWKLLQYGAVTIAVLAPLAFFPIAKLL